MREEIEYLEDQIAPLQTTIAALSAQIGYVAEDKVSNAVKEEDRKTSLKKACLRVLTEEPKTVQEVLGDLFQIGYDLSHTKNAYAAVQTTLRRSSVVKYEDNDDGLLAYKIMTREERKEIEK